MPRSPPLIGIEQTHERMSEVGKRVTTTECRLVGLPGSRRARRVRPIADLRLLSYLSPTRRFILPVFIGLPIIIAAQSSEDWLRKMPSRPTALTERKRALTITASTEALFKALENLSSRPHSWKIIPIRRDDATASVRLRWPQQPSYRDLGAILYVAQQNGLRISDAGAQRVHSK